MSSLLAFASACAALPPPDRGALRSTGGGSVRTLAEVSMLRDGC